MNKQNYFSLFLVFKDKYTKRLTCYHKEEGGDREKGFGKGGEGFTEWKTQEEVCEDNGHTHTHTHKDIHSDTTTHTHACALTLLHTFTQSDSWKRRVSEQHVRVRVHAHKHHLGSFLFMSTTLGCVFSSPNPQFNSPQKQIRSIPEKKEGELEIQGKIPNLNVSYNYLAHA